MNVKKLKKLLIFIALALLPLYLQSQIRGNIIDKETLLPLPFASINYKAAGQPKVVIADKSGSFIIPERNVENLQITFVGYVPKFLAKPENLQQPILIEMEKQQMTLTEVTVSPKNNPAHRIIRMAYANKAQNNFEKYEEYSYRNYSKILLEMDSGYSRRLYSS